MSDARELVAGFIDAINRRDEDRIRTIWAEDATGELPGDVRLEGADALADYVMAWISGFPDVQINSGVSFGAGEWAVLEYTFEGTHDGTLVGPAGEIPPTHQRVALRVVIVCRSADGRLAEVHGYWDQLQVLTQLGLMPEAATA